MRKVCAPVLVRAIVQEAFGNVGSAAKEMGRYICEQFKDLNLTVVNIYKIDLEATTWREEPFVFSWRQGVHCCFVVGSSYT